MDNEKHNWTATQFDSAADKEKFYKHFIRFVHSDFKITLFPKWFYNRLSNTFGHIAHYNQLQFFEHFFSTQQGKQDFIEQCITWPCWGDAAYTYSDVEKSLVEWLRGYTSGKV